MEVNVLAVDKLPEDYLLSIRAGTVRRQATLASNRPFRFPKITMEESPLKIDVLQQIATAYVVLKPNEDQYKVLFQGPGGVPSALSCEVEVKASDGDHGSKKEDDAVATKDATHGAKEAKDYLEEHQLLKFVQAALQAVIKERPKNPYEHMARHFMSGYGPAESRAPKKQVDPPLPTPKAEAVTQEAKPMAELREEPKEQPRAAVEPEQHICSKPAPPELLEAKPMAELREEPKEQPKAVVEPEQHKPAPAELVEAKPVAALKEPKDEPAVSAVAAEPEIISCPGPPAEPALVAVAAEPEIIACPGPPAEPALVAVAAEPEIIACPGPPAEPALVAVAAEPEIMVCPGPPAEPAVVAVGPSSAEMTPGSPAEPGAPATQLAAEAVPPEPEIAADKAPPSEAPAASAPPKEGAPPETTAPAVDAKPAEAAEGVSAGTETAAAANNDVATGGKAVSTAEETKTDGVDTAGLAGAAATEGAPAVAAGASAEAVGKEADVKPKEDSKTLREHAARTISGASKNGTLKQAFQVAREKK